MLKSFYKPYRVIAALAIAAAAGSVNAAPVSVSDLQNQTIEGQDFVFIFNGLASSDGTGGSLILRAQGDYDNGGLNTNEFLDWNAEGVVGANGVGNFNGTNGSGGPFDIATVFQPLGNILWQRTYSLTGLELDQLLADNMVTVNVDLDDGVDLFDPPNFVEISINYTSGAAPVPLPAAFPLLLAAIFGLAAVRTRKRAAA
ncbi:MAG: VPLPA-CTERM sorting domain-containing protein [Pseudomonadota bacterium]